MNTNKRVQKSLPIALLLVATMLGRAQAADAQTVEAISPGPPMWKVSSGDHSLWIFAILTPLEAGVNWQSDAVESVIARAQEYIYFKAPEPSIPLNPFKFINGLRMVLKLRNNPDGKLLEDVIPTDLYARFMPLVELYQIPDMEETRPFYAADSLRGYAVIANGLTEDHGIDIKIDSLVATIPSMTLTPIQLGPERLDYDFLMESAQRMSEAAAIEDEIHCLKLSVDSIETDIDGMRQRAQAWAAGDVNALRRNRDVIGARRMCAQVQLTSGLLEKAGADWLQAAEKALSSNSLSFAILELDELIEPGGLLEELKDRGYTIDAP